MLLVLRYSPIIVISPQILSFRIGEAEEEPAFLPAVAALPAKAGSSAPAALRNDIPSYFEHENGQQLAGALSLVTIIATSRHGGLFWLVHFSFRPIALMIWPCRILRGCRWALPGAGLVRPRGMSRRRPLTGSLNPAIWDTLSPARGCLKSVLATLSALP
jgi:hypothetical protein